MKRSGVVVNIGSNLVLPNITEGNLRANIADILNLYFRSSTALVLFTRYQNDYDEMVMRAAKDNGLVVNLYREMHIEVIDGIPLELNQHITKRVKDLASYIVPRRHESEKGLSLTLFQQMMEDVENIDTSYEFVTLESAYEYKDSPQIKYINSAFAMNVENLFFNLHLSLNRYIVFYEYLLYPDGSYRKASTNMVHDYNDMPYTIIPVDRDIVREIDYSAESLDIVLWRSSLSELNLHNLFKEM